MKSTRLTNNRGKRLLVRAAVTNSGIVISRADSPNTRVFVGLCTSSLLSYIKLWRYLKAWRVRYRFMCRCCHLIRAQSNEADSDESQFHPLLPNVAKTPLDSIKTASNFHANTSLIQTDSTLTLVSSVTASWIFFNDFLNVLAFSVTCARIATSKITEQRVNCYNRRRSHHNVYQFYLWCPKESSLSQNVSSEQEIFFHSSFRNHCA
ncbi:hypothetical protein AVEN_265675-1 [Araneus ventricosus]|uniref:Uncharacterized protein n=1 Tax=Araneus ventricosus TaxID=182803 RepID=A0A4Y2RFR6_ARAVE|nr:hypothetical protein AVEN_265675-1 [Araneus ventricosus]